MVREKVGEDCADATGLLIGEIKEARSMVAIMPKMIMPILFVVKM